MDNTKKDTSTFPTAKESLGGLDTGTFLAYLSRGELILYPQHPDLVKVSYSYVHLSASATSPPPPLYNFLFTTAWNSLKTCT